MRLFCSATFKFSVITRSLTRSVLVRSAPLIFLLFFWAISIWNLDRPPIVHPDEPWILSPGYKLFTQGVYGSDLFAGFNGVVFIDAHIADIFANYGDSLRDARRAQLRNFLLKHNARLIAQISDNFGEPFQIYTLEW